MLEDILEEETALLDRLDKLKRELLLQEQMIKNLDKVSAETSEALQDSVERIRLRTEQEKAEAQQKIAQANTEMEAIEQRAEEWVRQVYGLSTEALPAGYLARVLWKADGTAIKETGELTKDLRNALHINETSAQKAANKVRSIARSKYTRRTLVSAAAGLATVAVLDAAEPAFGWVFDRWWKLLAAAAASLLAYLAVLKLQQHKVFD